MAYNQAYFLRSSSFPMGVKAAVFTPGEGPAYRRLVNEACGVC
jgi:hypothetical protein